MSSNECAEPELSEACTARKSYTAARATTSALIESLARHDRSTQEPRRRVSSSERAEPEADEACTSRKSRAAA